MNKSQKRFYFKLSTFKKAKYLLFHIDFCAEIWGRKSFYITFLTHTLTKINFTVHFQTIDASGSRMTLTCIIT